MGSPVMFARTLRVLAVVPVATGTLSVLFGSAIIDGGGSPAASTESELRFYAVWWIGAGAFLAWASRDVVARGPLLRAFCALLFLGGLARLLAAADAGRPRPVFEVLMAIELVLAVGLAAWHARVVRSVTQRPSGRG